MSTALAIASVTHVLKDLLNNGLIDQNVSGATGGNVNVTALAPDRIDVSATGQSQLNLFMYRVSPNLGWNNTELPSRNAQGQRLSNPPLALNLHYLLTAYGASELHAEILLGYGMQLFHETPILDREAIRFSLLPASAGSAGGLPNDLQALASSNLANQSELIKITPEQINTEEISKLWAAFQAKYRPTAAYIVTVVLIENELSTKASLPVAGEDSTGNDGRKIHSFPYNQIIIENLLSRQDPTSPILKNQKILSGYQVVVKGKNLYSNNVEVTLNDIPVQILDIIEYEEIIFTIPSNISAGIQALQIAHKTLIGSPPQLLRSAESNIEPFVLCPNIISASVLNPHVNNNLRSGNIQIQVNPAIGEKQKVILFLNEYNPAAGADQLRAYSFNAPLVSPLSPPVSSNIITIPFKDVRAGTYILRLRVDGAESPLGARDATGYYFEPNITIN